jgi:FkbM family methyltransferase
MNYITKIKSLIKRKLFFYKLTRKILFNTLLQYKKLNIFNDLNLNTKSIFIDIGANEGLVTSYINDKFGCKIICFEPHPGCYYHLKKLFKYYSNIIIFNIAVSEKSSINEKLYLHKESTNSKEMTYAQGSSLESNKLNINKDKFILSKTISIDEILNNYDFIDVIKIDIETHEYKILPSIFNNMHKIGKIYCELNGSKKYLYLKHEYDFWIKKLKDANYYGSKFIEWS